jgi:hypothetical protein
MDSLRRNNAKPSTPISNAVDLRVVRNTLPFRQNVSTAGARIKNEREMRPPIIPDAGVLREGEPKYQNLNPRKNDFQNYDKTDNSEKTKEKPNKKISSLFSILMFLMVFAFVALIGWYEFKNKDNNDLEKLLSRNTSDADKSLTDKTGAASSKTATAAPSKAAPAKTTPESQIVSANTESANTGVTSPEETTESSEKKTYKNDSNGITFDYSSEYAAEENNGQIVVSKGDDTMWRMKIYNNEDKKEIKEWFDSYFTGKNNADCVMSDPTTLKIGTLVTKTMKANTDAGKCDGAGFFALNSTKSKVVRVRLDKADETEANKILSTFKFIK